MKWFNHVALVDFPNIIRLKCSNSDHEEGHFVQIDPPSLLLCGPLCIRWHCSYTVWPLCQIGFKVLSTSWGLDWRSSTESSILHCHISTVNRHWNTLTTVEMYKTRGIQLVAICKHTVSCWILYIGPLTFSRTSHLKVSRKLQNTKYKFKKIWIRWLINKKSLYSHYWWFLPRNLKVLVFRLSPNNPHYHIVEVSVS